MAKGTVSSASAGRQQAAVEVLFPPAIVIVLDLFRALGDFEEHYDVAALDALEKRLAATMGRELAKGLVSDALLLAFGLRRERTAPLEFRPARSRRGSLDEYRLMGLIGAAFWRDFVLAGEAAAALGVLHPQPLVSLARDVARRLEATGLTLEPPDARLLTPQPSFPIVEVARERVPDFRFSFDF